MSVEEELKELIISRYKSLRQFSIEIDLPYTTLSGMLERGIRNAGIQKVIKICQALAIDTDALADGRIEERKVNDEAVTFREKNLLKKYRSIDMNGKETVDYVLNDIYDRCVKEQEEIYEPTVMKPSFQACLSAGTGQFVFDDIPSELIEVPAEYKDIDFVIGVSGDSMEPTYHDGDKVMIKKQEVSVGQIGAFMINGVALLKELGVNCLISHNKEYDDIKFEEGMRIDCVGKVVGKLN